MPKLTYSGDEKDMTLAEIEDALEHARGAGASDGARVYAVLSTSGKIKEVTIPTGEDDSY